MYANKTVGVLVPAYNEEGYVGDVIDAIPPSVDRVYVVDDGSTDGTWAEIRAHAEEHNAAHPPEAPRFDVKVVPIRHEENRGAGGALKTGYRHALEDGMQVMATIDGDGQMDPEVLERYLDPIVAGEADYAKGNRFIHREDSEGMPRFRMVGNLVLSYLTKVASGYWQTMDPQNGYTAISREALERIDVDDLYEYYGYCNELLVRLNVEGLRVADVPCPADYGGECRSHIHYGEYVPRVSGMLLRSFLWRLKEKYFLGTFHPLALFYVVGMGIAGAGFAGLLARLTGGPGDGDRAPWPNLLVAGVVLFLLGAAFDMEEHRDLERRFADKESEEGATESGTNAREVAPRA